jgi:hypothetical protein
MIMNKQIPTTTIRDISTAQGVKRITALKLEQLRAESKRVMWEYYSAHKTTLPKYIKEYREDIIIGLMKGLSVEEVFNSVTEEISPGSMRYSEAA